METAFLVRSTRRNRAAVGIQRFTGELFGQLLLQFGVEKVLHSLSWCMQVIGGELEVGGQVRFP